MVVACLSNLRQIGLGLTSYTSDNIGRCPLVRRYQMINGVNTEVTMRNPSTATGQDIQEWQLLLSYYGGKSAMKGLYTCPMVTGDCDAQWPTDRFPYNGANGMPLAAYQLWYHRTTDAPFITQTITKMGESFRTGKQVVDGARWNILVSDVLVCRKYGMDYHDSVYGNAVNHVPYGEFTSGLTQRRGP